MTRYSMFDLVAAILIAGSLGGWIGYAVGQYRWRP